MNNKIKVWLAAAITTFAVGAMAIPTTFIDLGNIGADGTYTFDTEGSSILGNSADTELGLWAEDGTLLAANDDNGSGGLWSSITATLSAGTYFLGISEFISDFADGFLNNGTGIEPGEVMDAQLNIDGVLAGSGTLTDALEQETLFFGFTVGAAAVPESGTLFLLGAGFLAFGLSRRK